MQISKLVRNAWLPLLIVVVVAVGGFAVTRVKSFFGAHNTGAITTSKLDDSKPFKPKVVKYEIFGPAVRANVNYLDLSAEPRRVDNAPLPFTLVLKTTAPSVFPNIVAQSDGDYIGCRITVDDEVKDEKSTTGVHALTFCMVKSV
ncbi:MmpS family transport accessory protein [Candidatus Mycobacterium wuenschmannii]|uniref:MmpS family transport accessory protein n=1 Tax=Candidatus Mycobacterium wuenschmannii TaxID=3027808 RepID=A0ABY8VTZ7_9MYCO|nr:MmpS family transport accessory protein [Candidatus Mycobacterium wuenschmannii]WIM87123.1 MmpS family transport accessory protein [Candidatus Mycobacterium wuenschmannii]